MRTTKNIICTLLVLSLLLLNAGCTSACEEITSTLATKIIYETNSLTDDSSMDDIVSSSEEITVLLFFEESFSCNHTGFMTEQDVNEHKIELANMLFQEDNGSHESNLYE